MRNDVVNLGKLLDERASCLPWALLNGMFVGLVAWPRVHTLKVDCELEAELLPGSETSHM
jgi:hypothetical protein